MNDLVTLDYAAPRLAPELLPHIMLGKGSHDDRPSGLCVMEAVAWLDGAPHSDHPDCACPTIAGWARHTNDAFDQPYRDALRDRALRIAGSKAADAVERKRIRELAWRTIARIIPVQIEILAAVPELAGMKDELGRAAAALRGIGREDEIETWRAPAAQARATALKALALDLALDLAIDLDRALALARTLALARARAERLKAECLAALDAMLDIAE